MYLSARTLDDALRRVLEKLLHSGNIVKSTRGNNVEIMGALLTITNPRARLSRTDAKGTVFSCLGELLWYLSSSNELKFIAYYLTKYEEYSDDGKIIYGGYGPRLFKMRGQNQVSNILRLLKSKPGSRQAVIQLFDARDLEAEHSDIPCTCTLQFILRDSRLHMFTNMRSNDAYIGLPHDIFCFTMLQEIMARSLGVELGVYKHAVGSLHLYDRNRDAAWRYLDEGWQPTISAAMPPMPFGDPWPSIGVLRNAESHLRSGKSLKISELKIDSYWLDLVRLLQVFRYAKDGKNKEIELVKSQMTSGVYNMYIAKRQSTRRASGKRPRRAVRLRDK